MPGRLGPRFAIEALFLIALAAGVAYADLSRKWIAAVMAGGWVVVALLELTADRIWAAAPPWRRPDYFAAPMPRAEPAAPPAPAAEPARGPEPKPRPEPEPEPVAAADEPEAATVIAQRPEPPAQEPEAADAGEERPRPKLEPLDAKPKRRWFHREAEEVPDETTEIPLPKHVRLLPPSERQAAPDEIAEPFDEREENTSA